MKQTNRRGRPKASNPRNIDFKIRLSKKEYSDLETIAKSLGWPKAKVFRNVLNIVRCKDCIYFDKSLECWYKDSKYYHCRNLDTCTDENFYCANGKRRDEDEQTH